MAQKIGTEADWLEFAAIAEEPNEPRCPFCGLRHKPGRAHPFCDMAGRFNSWLAMRG